MQANSVLSASRRRRIVPLLAEEPMKILLAPSNVADQSTSATVGLTALGHDVQI